MSRSALNLYPVLTSALIENIGFKVEPVKISYITETGRHYIELQDIEETDKGYTCVLHDPLNRWVPDENEATFELSFSANNVKHLFGKDGVVEDDAEIGVAVLWIDSKAQFRRYSVVGSFKKNSRKINYHCKQIFQMNSLKGSIVCQIVLFVKSAGTITNVSYFATQSGTVLGTIGKYEFFVDGNGTVFPIYIENRPGELLWRVEYSSSNPLEDEFDVENVAIVLNSAHPLYDTINLENPMADKPLMTEILASAMLLICNTAKDTMSKSDWSDIIAGEGLEEGSIGNAIYYFTNKLQWDFSDPICLSDSIRKYFEKQVQGGAL